MKKHLAFLSLLTLFIISTSLFGQGPPDPPGDPGAGGGPVGGSAPIGSGLGIMIVFVAAYGGKKVYDLHKDSMEE